MKQGWEYKKLGEVCEVVSGSTPKTNVPEYWGEGHYWVTPAELNDTIVYIDKTERQITDEALTKTKLRLLPVGTVLLSSRAPIGKVAITKTEMYCNQGFKNCICSDSIYNKYLFYFLRLKKEYLNSLGRGATFKEISKSIVESITIPLPPKSTQLSIVSELDKINELIRLKKEQLKDYDNLAQSIFYEMFGDPVENDKGWKVKKLGEVCDIFAGGDKPKDIKTTKDNEYIYPVIANGEGKKGILGYSKKCRVIKNAVTIGARGASIGNCRIVKDGFTPAIRLLTLIPSEKLDCPFLFYIVKGLDYKQNGAGQAQLTVPNIKNERIILPPLPLQHLFAQRLEQIERQRSAVQKSITDLETLLASRMQYWFE